VILCGEAGAAQVYRIESFAAVERDRDLRELVLEIGEQLKRVAARWKCSSSARVTK
jgi:hypothetical protein